MWRSNSSAVEAKAAGFTSVHRTLVPHSSPCMRFFLSAFAACHSCCETSSVLGISLLPSTPYGLCACDARESENVLSNDRGSFLPEFKCRLTAAVRPRYEVMLITLQPRPY